MTRLHHSLRARKTAVLAALGASAAIATTFALALPAGAIPAAQAGCNLDTLAITPASGFFPLTSARSVSVSSARTVKVDATADVGVDARAEVRLAWSVNSSTPVEASFGPANFANHQEFFETRSTFGLINVGSGTTTIQPFVRVSGPSGARATLLHRCSTVEASTS